ncbi:Vacuolar protein sorting-associated protein 29 [Savitreella phatthalungensis]
MLVLLIGDLHIPHRSPDLPSQFKKLLAPGKIAQVLCTGNLTDRRTFETLRRIAPEMHVVRGDCDDAINGASAVFGSRGSSAVSNSTANAISAAQTTGVGAPLPMTCVVTLGQGSGGNDAFGGVRVGLTNGFAVLPRGDGDALMALARQTDVDVLVWGGTHKFEAYELGGRFFINPGSATGAPSWTPEISTDGAERNHPPSFVLMDVQGKTLVLYVYQLIHDDVKVEKFRFEKQ